MKSVQWKLKLIVLKFESKELVCNPNFSNTNSEIRTRTIGDLPIKIHSRLFSWISCHEAITAKQTKDFSSPELVQSDYNMGGGSKKLLGGHSGKCKSSLLFHPSLFPSFYKSQTNSGKVVLYLCFTFHQYQLVLFIRPFISY